MITYQIQKYNKYNYTISTKSQNYIMSTKDHNNV